MTATKPGMRFRVIDRHLTDDEIIQRARFPLLERAAARSADYAMALIAHGLFGDSDTPMSLVTWPCGVKAMVLIRTGDKSERARRELISTYRAAEAGIIGPVVSHE